MMWVIFLKHKFSLKYRENKEQLARFWSDLSSALFQNKLKINELMLE